MRDCWLLFVKKRKSPGTSPPPGLAINQTDDYLRATLRETLPPFKLS